MFVLTAMTYSTCSRFAYDYEYRRGLSDTKKTSKPYCATEISYGMNPGAKGAHELLIQPGEKSKKQIRSHAARPHCYSSSSVPEYSSEGQMRHIGGTSTIKAWPQASLSGSTPSPLDSHAVSQRLSELEGLPMEQYTSLLPVGQTASSQDDGLCLYTPPVTEMCFDFEPMCALPQQLSTSHPSRD